MSQPLLIGGATTSRMHTAVKIAPEYDNGVVHVLDASRSVTVAGNLLNIDSKGKFLSGIVGDYDKLRESFANKKSVKEILPFDDAQKNKVFINWDNYSAPQPSFTGIKTFPDFDLALLRDIIDWKPFFIAWEMHGNFPAILSDAVVGKEATKLYDDANALLDKIISEKWLTAKGVIGFWEANTVASDTIAVKNNDEVIHLEMLRQQSKKASGQPNFSLADFVKPASPTPPREGLNTVTASTEANAYHRADPMLYGLLKDFVKKIRINSTEAENVLWQCLRGKKLEEYKFRRQHIIGSYIADFICLSKKLIVEVDGLIHQLPENQVSDVERTAWLNDQGFEVIRFTNDEVLGNVDDVLEKVLSRLKASSSEAFAIPPSGGRGADYIGAFAVSIHGIEKHIKAFETALDDYNKIMLQALADRFAEAFAEALHQQTRKEYWGYVKEEALNNEELIKEKYVGIRPAPGYPACPDHTEKYKLFKLLKATENAGIELTESLAMYPASSVCGWYFSHPQSQYFGIGKIQRDQLEDYTSRKGMPLAEMERWLSPILD
jgi:5-methyltetrahydrofolate--homocysteine methyltransferase